MEGEAGCRKKAPPACRGRGMQLMRVAASHFKRRQNTINSNRFPPASSVGAGHKSGKLRCAPEPRLAELAGRWSSERRLGRRGPGRGRGAGEGKVCLEEGIV